MSDYKPITGELRKVMNHTELRNVPLVELGEYEFARRCDEIDAIHAGLERENAKLRELVDYMTPIAWYAASERERDRMCELGVEVDA